MSTSSPAETPIGLATPVTRLRSVGVRAGSRLEKLGIRTVRHLLWHLPSRYEDYRAIVPIAQVVPNAKQSIRGQVIAIVSRFIWPRRMSITTATIQDGSGAIRAVWFNQPYLQDSLSEGTVVSLAGKAVLDKRGLYLSNPVYEKLPTSDSRLPTSALQHTGRLVPVYPETAGMTSKYLRYLVSPLLDGLQVTDHLPMTVRRQYGLVGLAEALRTVHYPESLQDVSAARMRLAFDDLLLLQLKALADRRLVNLQRSAAIPMDAGYMRTLVAALPFTLTRDQRVSALEVLRDMERPFPMNRLLEGDVGSGKTAVAILAALHAAKAGWQTAILAPTEVLAVQHYRTLRALATAPGARTALMTGSQAFVDDRPMPKAQAKRIIATRASVVVGTHALLENDVRLPRLALVVIDEQHRFGIHQRSALLKPTTYNLQPTTVPHLLSMTATPIPRTLALTIFGDLDISIIREKPKGRQAIATRVVLAHQRGEMHEFVREQVRAGRQAFVICPRIEVEGVGPDSPGANRGSSIFQPKLKVLGKIGTDVKAVQDEYEKLSKEVFPDLKIAMLHGRMKPKEKERIMREFKEGWHDILVSTSVVEVGVDVPNASVMVIEGADRFGLAQLHQFRGRVGRAEHQSHCFLLATDDGAGRKRLETVARTDDGFKLAEADMKLRGPGEFFGVKQSGLPDLTMAALADVELIKKARAVARAIMKADPELKRHPLLKEQLDSFRSLAHSE